MHRSYLSTITSLARTIEAKDPYTGGHTERVAELAGTLAAELGFDEAELQAVNVGAVIHDIGKIGVPDRVLLKQGPLDRGRVRGDRSATRRSRATSWPTSSCRRSSSRWSAATTSASTAAGYPDGLAGEEIPLAARILAVADALDAMTSDRPYRSGAAGRRGGHGDPAQGGHPVLPARRRSALDDLPESGIRTC